jgi:AcrR family transcriptional regulator
VTGDSRRRKPGARERKVGDNGHGNRESQSQRERLINAFTKIASERGWAETTVAEVAAAAGTTEAEFHRNFANLRQCLSAAHDAFFSRLTAEVEAAVDDVDEWPYRVREAVAATLEFVEETAPQARFFAVDALFAGPMILERENSELERVVPLMREGRERSPSASGLPPLTEPILVSGAACLLRGALLGEGPIPLERYRAELVEVLLSPYVGPAEATRIAG